jgi:N-acetylglucosamine-6-phosphate deacetylase
MGIHWYLNARIVLESSIIDRGYIQVVNGVIARVGQGQPSGISEGDEIIDVNRNWVVPGFIDVHVHGADGCNFMTGKVEQIERITRFHAKHGTTCLLATTTTSQTERLTLAIERLADYVHSGKLAGSRVAGLHVEGPFISQKRRGAQDSKYILDPDFELMEKWLSLAKGTIRLMTIAPERPGALQMIRNLVNKGITVGAGHTDATYAEAIEGIRHGITHSIHTFNGMRPLHHRDPGVLGAVMEDNRVRCEIICDGHHVHPRAIRLLYQVKGPHGIILITDAIDATGLPDGEYRLDTQPVILKDGKVELADGSSLAGSVLTMSQAYRNALCYLPITMVEASLMASTNPAESVGLGHRKGRIREGMDADLVVLDQNLEVILTVVEGQKVYSRNDRGGN